MATSDGPKSPDRAIEDLFCKVNVWLGKAMKDLNCPVSRYDHVTKQKCRALGREDLVELFNEAFHFVWYQNVRLQQTMTELNATKSELVKSQKLVIVQQHEVIVSKDKLLASVQNAVTASVQSAVTASVSETVQAEIKSYSEAVKCSTESNQISSETLKSAVKSAVQEEDRGKNLMMFGVPEEGKENLSEKVQEVFSELGLKPVTEVCRVGKTGSKERPRPVKVTLSCVSTARHVLVQAKKLRSSEKFSAVFIRPDRTLEERAAHRLLIEELK